MELTRDPVLKRGPDMVRGVKIEVSLKENRVKIYSGDQQKVTAVVKSVGIPQGSKGE
jgi:lipopolysaccharide export system protein LptA